MPKAYYTLGTDIEFVGPPPAIEKEKVQVALVKINNVEQYLAFTVKPDDHKCLRPLDDVEITKDLEAMGAINETQDAKTFAKRLTDNGNRFNGIFSVAARTYAASTWWLMNQMGKTNFTKFQDRLLEKNAEVHKNGIIPLVAPKDQKILRANLEGSAFVANEPKEEKVAEKPKRKAAEKKPKGAGKAPRDASPVRPAAPKEKNIFERWIANGKIQYEHAKPKPKIWLDCEAAWSEAAFGLVLKNPTNADLARIYCVIMAVALKLPSPDKLPELPTFGNPTAPSPPPDMTLDDAKAYVEKVLKFVKQLQDEIDKQVIEENDFVAALNEKYTLSDWAELIHNSPLTFWAFEKAMVEVPVVQAPEIARLLAITYFKLTVSKGEKEEEEEDVEFPALQ